MVSFKAILAYLLFAVLATVFFLVLLFPDQAVKAYLEGRLAAVDPSLTVAIEVLRPATMPPGLTMSGVDLSRDGTRLVRLDDARLRPQLQTLLTANKRARFDAQLADGMIQGLAMVQDGGPTGRLQVEADLSQIRLELLDAIKANDRFALSGLLGGQIKYDKTRSKRGATSGSLAASQLKITLKEAFFGIDELMVGQADATFSVDGDRLRLKALTFDGPMLAGKINGTIELRRPLEQSRLNLTGNAKPRPELFAQLQERIPKGLVNARTLGTRGLNFKIRGSAASPDLSLR